MRSLAFALALVVSSAAVVPQARAAVSAADASPEDLARARRAFKKGEKLYALAKFGDALKEYERAFEIVELPEFLFNIGQCQRNLEQFDEAIFSFKQFLTRKPDAPNKAAVEELIAELEAQKKKTDGKRLTKRLDRQGEGGGGGSDPVTDPFADETPLYKKWWFLTGVGAVVVAGAAIYLGSSGGGGVPSSDLGNVDLR